MTLCISGIEDREQRESIQRILSLGGGRYIRNIEGEVVLTHLLCGSSRGGVDERGWTAKMQHVDKLMPRGLTKSQWFGIRGSLTVLISEVRSNLVLAGLAS